MLETWEERIGRAFRAAVAPYPLLEKELDALLPALSGEEQRCLRAVYAGLGVEDLTGAPPERLLAYVRATILARRELAYAVDIPEELFVSYVLPPRVNNEDLDGSRGWLYGQLADRVRGKDMLSAALEVNYWCCEHAAYLPTDDRTIGPMGLCRRTRGRCGEESTLAVAALRASCIPARQVYAPRWAHCDDNHAWVEFWARGQWHYMGACEPEPVPDAGWFTAAASRAMLVRALAPDFEGKEGCAVVNVTARYADTCLLTVQVRAGGAAQAGVPVRFQLVNDSRLCTIYEAVTGSAGAVTFEAGLGDLVVSAFFRGRLVERRVDLRRERHVLLDWEAGFDPLAGERTEGWELVPPRGRIPSPNAEDAAHRERLGRCEKERKAYEDTFCRDGSRWLRLARGNREEIERFLALEEFEREDKEALLNTLSEKDFADITSETLEDALAAALPWKERYKKLVWENWILAPRVEHEMLLPVRCELLSRLAGEGLKTGEDVLAWMGAHLRPVEGDGPTDRRGDAAAYLRHGVCPRPEWEIVAVQLCRALGIPSLIDHDTGRIQLVGEGGAYTPGAEGKSVRLQLHAKEGPLTYREHFSLARWMGEDYRTLELEHTVRDYWDIFLPPGSYRLTTARRQIDGSLSVRVSRFLLKEDRVLTLVLGPDQTAEKLLCSQLPSVMCFPITGTVKKDLTAPTRAGSLLIFAQPGTEPTEHLFQELLELRQAYREGGWPLSILLSCPEEAENATLRRVLEELPGAACYLPVEELRYQIRQAMGVGDSRLPLAVVLDRAGRGVYACANYNIRSAHTLLRILNMLQKKRRLESQPPAGKYEEQT